MKSGRGPVGENWKVEGVAHAGVGRIHPYNHGECCYGREGRQTKHPRNTNSKLYHGRIINTLVFLYNGACIALYTIVIDTYNRCLQNKQAPTNPTRQANPPTPTGAGAQNLWLIVFGGMEWWWCVYQCPSSVDRILIRRQHTGGSTTTLVWGGPGGERILSETAEGCHQARGALSSSPRTSAISCSINLSSRSPLPRARPNFV